MGGLRVGLLNGFGVTLLAALASCGGRTSTLDPDVMGAANQPNGGFTSNPPPGAGASPGTGAGGSGATSGAAATGGTTPGGTILPPVGSAGSPSAGGSPGIGGTGSAGMAPSAGASTGRGGSPGVGGIDGRAFSKCVDYCNTSAPEQPCTSGLSSAKCTSACTAELGGLELACQDVAGRLLECLTIVYQNSRNCGDVQQLSSIKCSNLFASYERCADDRQVPPPPPPPPPPSKACSGTGSGGPGKCIFEYQCPDGAHYTAACYELSPYQSTCTCTTTFADGSGSSFSFGLDESARTACLDSLSLCGFPGQLLK